MSEIKKSLLHMFLRVTVYILIIVIISQVIVFDATSIDGQIKFGENSLTEIGQELILLIKVLLLVFFSFIIPNCRGFLLLLAMFATLGLIREFNNYLNEVIIGGWKLPFFGFLGVYILLLRINKNTILQAFTEFAKHPAFGVMLSGFLTVFVFSRLFGQKIIWANALQVSYLNETYRSVKNLAEEGTELFGYTLIFVAVIEYLWLLPKKWKTTS